jgi:hypothetical protein
VDQELGLIDSLLIDGKTVNWQVAERAKDGSLRRDTELVDMYFPGHKAMQLTESGALTVVMDKQDTTSQIEKATVIELHLHFERGPQDFCSLLETRGDILTAVEQSEPAQLVNVSGEAVGLDPLFESNSRTETMANSTMAVNAKPSVVEQKAQELTALAAKTTMETHRQHNVNTRGKASKKVEDEGTGEDEEGERGEVEGKRFDFLVSGSVANHSLVYSNMT